MSAHSSNDQMDIFTERLIHLFKKAQSEYGEGHMVVAIPGFLSKKFIGYCSMKEDLELCLKYLIELEGDSNETISSALTYSLISLYGKCFTDATKNKYPKLEAGSIFKNDKEMLKTHEYLIELRHQFIAHRGKTESEVGIAYLAIPKEGDEQSQVRYSHVKRISFPTEDIKSIEATIQFLLAEIKPKIQKHGQKIYDAMFEMFTADQLAVLMVNNMK